MHAFDGYLVTGGYPRLALQCARFASVHDYVADQLQDENNDLVVIAERSLDAEFGGGDQARRVLSAIGGVEVGPTTFSQVVGRLPEEGTAAQTAISRAVKLLSVGLVRGRWPGLWSGACALGGAVDQRPGWCVPRVFGRSNADFRTGNRPQRRIGLSPACTALTCANGGPARAPGLGAVGRLVSKDVDDQSRSSYDQENSRLECRKYEAGKTPMTREEDKISG